MHSLIQRRAVREATRLQEQQIADNQSQEEGSQTSLNELTATLPPESELACNTRTKLFYLSYYLLQYKF